VFHHRDPLHILLSDSPIVGRDPVGRPIDARNMHGMDFSCSERGYPVAGATHRVSPIGAFYKHNAIKVIGHHHKLIINACSIIAEPLHIIPSNSPFVGRDPVGRPIAARSAIDQRILPVQMPLGRIVDDVFTNPCQVSFIPDDVFEIIPLPETCSGGSTSSVYPFR